MWQRAEDSCNDHALVLQFDLNGEIGSRHNLRLWVVVVVVVSVCPVVCVECVERVDVAVGGAVLWCVVGRAVVGGWWVVGEESGEA